MRKGFDCSAHLLPGLCLIGTGYLGCDRAGAVALLTLAVGSAGLVGGGFLVNHLDIGPPFAGVLFALTNSAATIPGFAGPAVSGSNTLRGLYAVPRASPALGFGGGGGRPPNVQFRKTGKVPLNSQGPPPYDFFWDRNSGVKMG